ncbi:MAG: NAD(+)/NADH kinase [Phycisphaerales bacterium]|nr:NAD(+)/NADH kinase [Phycisphaerales bacterium]
MRIGILANARAGKGRAGPLVARVEALLRGHDVETHWVHQGEPWASSLPDRILVFGGDGTIHRALPLLSRVRTPFLPVPAGTENLLARQWKVNADPEEIADRAVRGPAVDIDGASCNSRLFILMASLGPDASVIHRLQAKRRARISHLTYVGPIAREALAPAIPTIRRRADGGGWSEPGRGVLIVANSPMYAMRANPCAEADMTDGALDALFMPCGSTTGVVRWAVRAARRRAWTHPRAAAARVSAIEVSHEGGTLRVQLDGEPAEASAALRLECLPRALRIIGEVGEGAT